MLDVHLPHKRFHGFWDFLIHLFTITVGLFIAVQIESCVEWRHHVHLAEEARTSLRAEITSNLNSFRGIKASVEKHRKELDEDILELQAFMAHPNDPKAQPHNLIVSFAGVSLDETAWRTAQSTGALNYMPYDEAQRYVNIYQALDQYQKASDRPMEDLGVIGGILADEMPNSKTPFTIEESVPLTRKLGEMRWHLGLLSAVVDANIELDSAFLENRTPKNNFNVDMK